MAYGQEKNQEKVPESGHISVLRDEVVEFLRPRAGGRYVDGTLGLGGHSRAIMEASGGQAELLGLDRDTEAIAIARERLAEFGGRVRFAHTTFSQMAEALDNIGWERIDGALVDLGVSSLQLDRAERGFSFLNEGPLDMRMDGTGVTGDRIAADIVNSAPMDELKQIISEYGEEPQAGRIARRIIEERQKAPITDTLALAKLVEAAYPAKWRATARMHPATRTFQALRMAVNGELDQLREFLEAALDRLNPGGRVAVISFHSLEDRIVKHYFRDQAKECICPPRLPRCVCKGKHFPAVTVLTRKPVSATEEEIRLNSRSRSAKLRVAERLDPQGKRAE